MSRNNGKVNMGYHVVEKYVAGRIMDFKSCKVVGKYAYDVVADYVAYNLGGHSKRFDGTLEEFEMMLWASKKLDTTVEKQAW